MKKILIVVGVVLILIIGLFTYNSKKDTRVTEVYPQVIPLSYYNSTTTKSVPSLKTPSPISAEEKLMIETNINKQFGTNWAGYSDACGYGSLTNIKSITRTSVGYTVQIQYLCGMVTQGTVPSETTVYVSNTGKVTGVPAPKN